MYESLVIRGKKQKKIVAWNKFELISSFLPTIFFSFFLCKLVILSVKPQPCKVALIQLILSSLLNKPKLYVSNRR